MNTAFTRNGWDAYRYWIKTGKAMVKRINQLINECLPDPAFPGPLGLPREVAVRAPQVRSGTIPDCALV